MEEFERIDDLGIQGLKIIQNTKGFCFGIDSVLLSDFAKDIKKDAKVIDLGTGTGIIATLLCAKTKLKHIVGVEIQEKMARMANRSIQLNKLQEKFKILNIDIKELIKYIELQSIDAIVTNPPYKTIGTGIANEEELKLISRHETTATLEDFIKISSQLLKSNGEFYMVHRPERLVDCLQLLRQYHLEPKKIRFVCPNEQKPSNMFLIKSIKNAKPFLKVEPNLYVYNKNGEYTREIMQIYEKGDKK